MNVRSEKSRLRSGHVRIVRPASSTPTTNVRTRRRRAKLDKPAAPRTTKPDPAPPKEAFATSTHPEVDSTAIYLTVKETAKLLRTTPRAIYTMIHRGLLPGVRRVGRRVLVVRAELIRWIDACNAVVDGPAS